MEPQTTRQGRGARKITCPVLFLSTTKDDVYEVHEDPEGIRREWADDVTAIPGASRHNMAEDPEPVAAALLEFLRR